MHPAGRDVFGSQVALHYSTTLRPVRPLLAIATTALLSGCWSSAGEPPKQYRTKSQRLKDAEIAVSKTPTPRTYRLTNGELQVIEVPTADSGGRLDIQRCFVWRDQEYKQASLSCEPPHDFGELAPEYPDPR